MALGFGVSAHGQEFPSKPVRIIVPAPAGGSMDGVARLLAQHLGTMWKQTVVVDNRSGGASVTGTKLLAEAPGDGYTLGMMANVFTVSPALHSKLPYDAVRDFVPITMLTQTPNVLVAHSPAPAKNLKDFLVLAKAGSKQYSSGSVGNGTAAHLALERLKAASGVDILHVPFQGLAPGITAVLGGHTDLMMANLPDVLPHLKSGRLVALAVGSEKRHPNAPDAPTFVESGFPGFVSHTWYGIAAPAGTPQPVIRKLHDDLAALVKRPDIQAQLGVMGLDPASTSVEEFGAFVRSEISSNAELVKRAGIHAD